MIRGMIFNIIQKTITLSFLIVTLSACATLSHTPQPNQVYLDAQKKIRSLPADEYQILNDQTIYLGPFSHKEIFSHEPTQGILISPDGSFYQGEIRLGKADGFGKSHLYSGEQYEGRHQLGQFEGDGRLLFSDGSLFIGAFKNNKAYRGKMYFADGNVADFKIPDKS